jgi:hypothetical protein
MINAFFEATIVLSDLHLFGCMMHNGQVLPMVGDLKYVRPATEVDCLFKG